MILSMSNANSPFHADLIERAQMGFVHDCMDELTSEQYIVEFHPVKFGGVRIIIRSMIIPTRAGYSATCSDWSSAMAGAIADLDQNIYGS